MKEISIKKIFVFFFIVIKKHLYSSHNFKKFAHCEDLKNLSKPQNIIIKKY